MKIVAAAILLSFNLSLLAGTYHVAPSGNDAHGGAQEAPFQTLGRAVSAAAPGDTILMRGGKHSYAATVVIDKAGTSNSPIRLEAFPGERPVLDFSSWKPADEAARFDARGILLTTNARWWVLKGLEICYAPDAGVKSARLKPGSKLIDRGVNVGLPFTGSAPGLGPYEFRQ